MLEERVASSVLKPNVSVTYVFGTWGFFPSDARKNCPFVLTSFTGWSSERCPGIGFLSRGDREIGVLRNVEPPTRPRPQRWRVDRPSSSRFLPLSSVLMDSASLPLSPGLLDLPFSGLFPVIQVWVGEARSEKNKQIRNVPRVT